MSQLNFVSNGTSDTLRVYIYKCKDHYRTGINQLFADGSKTKTGCVARFEGVDENALALATDSFRSLVEDVKAAGWTPEAKAERKHGKGGFKPAFTSVPQAPVVSGDVLEEPTDEVTDAENEGLAPVVEAA